MEWEDRDGIAIAWLDKGPVNALDADFLHDIAFTLGEIDTSDCAALVLTGRGQTFSAGADLRAVLEGGRDYIYGSVGALTECFEALFTFRKPAIAAVNGHAIAGGCILACACDYRVMSAGTIGVTELAVGVPFPTYALEIIRFAVGAEHFQELVYLAQTYPPDRAIEKGLVDEVVGPNDLINRALVVAREMAEIPFESFELMKRAVRRPALDRIAAYSSDQDDMVKELWASEKVTYAIRRFMQRIASSRS
jgi:enoyl-CoA hydratase